MALWLCGHQIDSLWRTFCTRHHHSCSLIHNLGKGGQKTAGQIELAVDRIDDKRGARLIRLFGSQRQDLPESALKSSHSGGFRELAGV